MACTACLVCFISTVNGHCNKKKKIKEEAYPRKAGASSRHTTNLKQSISRLSISMLCLQSHLAASQGLPDGGHLMEAEEDSQEVTDQGPML